jgi:hypothetical protein
MGRTPRGGGLLLAGDTLTVKNFKSYLMKTTVKLLICAALLALPCAGFAQHTYPWNSSMDVNGIFIGSVYSKDQVTAKWGTPTKYWSGESEFGLDEEYHYSKNLFRFSDNGIFGEFHIYTSNFVVYTAQSGGIKVGDDVSRIAAIGLGTPVKRDDETYNIPSGDDRFFVKHANGKITRISFISPI